MANCDEFIFYDDLVREQKRRAPRQRAGGSSRLLQDAFHANQAASVPADPAAWASGSCRVRLEAGFYPAGQAVDEAYAAKWDAALVTNLMLAGRRLAETLNDFASSDASRIPRQKDPTASGAAPVR